MPDSPISRLKLPLALASWITFAISLTFYWLTVDPEVSYWDCPEYVTVASKMEVGHPPGNPVWMLAMRVATIPFDPSNHALVINLCSGLFMAFAAFFLSRLIFIPVRLSFLSYSQEKKFLSSKAANFISGAISIGASLCFALCDSSWYSAVEAEVYAMSAFLSAASLWIMTIWWFEPSSAARTRWLILLAYLIGLSLGVHQLNLLLIPVYGLIILYRRNPQKIHFLIILSTLTLSLLIIILILMVLMPGSLAGARVSELLFVNHLSFSYHSGVIIFALALFVLFLITLYFTKQGGHFNTVVWMVGFIFLGFSSFGIIMLRAQASPPMNEGAPDNIFSLSSYINREQYPSSPLLYGHTPYSKPLFEEEIKEGNPTYSRYLLKKGSARYVPLTSDAILKPRSGMLSSNDSLHNNKIKNIGHGYLLSDYNFSQILTPELDMWFPRMTSRHTSDIRAYEDWAGMSQESMQHLSISETRDSLGNFLPRMFFNGHRPEVFSYKPTYLQNLRFFISYQAYYMYFRYLFWNFIGRQNDIPSTGEIEHGNFITGIPAIDLHLPGVTEEMPSEIWERNKGRNRYFGIPFLFGIIGIVFLAFGSRKDRRILTLITVAFLMTGLAIVVYLNQSPGEPRERDYTFLGSYMAFTMWIAAGLTATFRLFYHSFPTRYALIIAGLFSLGIPALMATENFDDHDRRGRSETGFFASSLLDFEVPAIIFSHGDNSTFPLWYLKEVVNPDSPNIPVDVTYLSLPSYVINLKKQGNRGIKTLASTPELAYDAFILSRLPADSTLSPLPLAHTLKTLYTSKESIPTLPASKVIIPSSNTDSMVINLRDFTRGSSWLSFRHLMLLDILAAQETDEPKVIFFPSLIDYSFYKPLEPVLYPALFGKIYAPEISSDSAMSLLRVSFLRELNKLEHNYNLPYYPEPILADRISRYRGEMIIAARHLFNNGHTTLAVKALETLSNKLPYNVILPGTFTNSDTTYYEGKEFVKLIRDMGTSAGSSLNEKANSIDSLITRRKNQWLRYYQSLSPEERTMLSNRSKRLIGN